ncbi:sterile alpha motif domain-containing protein 1 [Athene noctua]|uniref:sterile alpha motif domain-containing protein 1 n=1 Tax=Athene noctua TaxID=126797 RepID=UPI003EB9C0DF
MAGPPPPPPGPEAPRYQEWILDTIDSLRSRKARPDLERICRMVRRRHGPEPERTRAELEKLIQQRAVLRVSYKGSISYRNAARVQPPRRPPAAAAAAARPPRRAARQPPRRRPVPRRRWPLDPRPPAGIGVTGGRRRDGLGGLRRWGGPPTAERRRSGGPPTSPTRPAAPRAAPQPKACSPGESACHHLAPLKKEGAFGQPDRAVSPALAGAEPSVPLSPGRPGPQAADGAPFSCTAGKKEKAADPVEWSVRDVVDYFTEAGFPEQATAFQEQEIDGKSLLLMQRADVLTGLSIRLGPALKIYEYHVKLLQRSHFQEEEPPPEPFPA